MSRIFSPTKISQFLMLLATSFFVAVASAQGAPREIVPIDPPQPTPNDGKIEVLEFFSYGCIHCANLEPPLESWAAKLPPDVKFVRVPSGLNLMGVDEISVFHTLEAMGELERLHKKIFEALHNERVMLGHKPTFLKWIEKQGISPQKYETVEKSFSVQTKVMRGRNLMSQYKVNSTPVVVVDGRTQVVQIGGASNMLATIDGLINQARTSQAAKTAPSNAAPAKATPAKAAPAKPVPAKPAPAPAK